MQSKNLFDKFTSANKTVPANVKQIGAAYVTLFGVYTGAKCSI